MLAYLHQAGLYSSKDHAAAERDACKALLSHTFKARSVMTSGVTFFPFLTSRSRAGRSSVSSAAFARLFRQLSVKHVCE